MIALYNIATGSYGEQQMSTYDPEYQRQYRIANAARLKEASRLRKLRDPIKYAAAKRADYDKHTAAYKERAKAHREKHAEAIKQRRSTVEYKAHKNALRRANYVPSPKPLPMTRAQRLAKKREDYALNKPRYQAQKAEFYKANSDKWKGDWQKRPFWQRKYQRGMSKAALKGAYIESGDSLKLFYKQLFTQAVVACDYCGQKYSTRYITVDHKTPYVLGGKHAVSNLAVSCLECNLRKGEMPFEKWIASYKTI